MEGRKFHRIYWIIKLSFIIVIFSSCVDKNEMKDALKDISSNAYYICLKVRNKSRVQDIVIPNNKLYHIISSENTGTTHIKSYIKMIYPILANDEMLEVSEDTYNKLKPFFIQPNWALNEINIDNFFSDGVQCAQIEDERVIIKQLHAKGYLTYKDDETGMLVIRKF